MSRSGSQFAPMALDIMRHMVARGVKGCTVTEMCEAGTSYPTANNTRRDLLASGWITETTEQRFLEGSKKGSVVYVATSKLVEFIQAQFGTESDIPVTPTVTEPDVDATTGTVVETSAPALVEQYTPMPGSTGDTGLRLENCTLRVSSALSLFQGIISKYDVDEDDFGPVLDHLLKAEKALGQM